MRKGLLLVLALVFVTPAAVFADSMTYSVIPGQDAQLGASGTGIDYSTAEESDCVSSAYCVDVQHYVGNSRKAEVGDMADWRQPYMNPGFPYPGYAGRFAAWLTDTVGIPDDLENRSAMQLALWKTMFKDKASYSSNVAKGPGQGQAEAYGVPPEVTDQANSFPGLVNNLESVPDALAPLVMTTGGNGPYYEDFTTPVPEPSTLLLLGAGVVGIALWKKRNH